MEKVSITWSGWNKLRTMLAYSMNMELGWELCTWIPAMRHKSLEYDETVVVCKPGFDYLYQDFANTIYNYDKKIKDLGYYGWSGKKPTKLPRKFKLLYPKADVFIPNERICTKWPRKYIKYGEYDENLHSDIILHCRIESKFGRDNRNLPPRKFEKLIGMLRNDRELSICSIGSFDGAAHVNGTLDLRGIGFEELCNRMASSNVFVSVSSGPAHLASLCGCNHVIWTDNKRQKAIKGTNRDRYEELWNPLYTKVKVIDSEGWRPKVKTVYEAVKRFL